jgi:hypothetical protein
LDLVNALMGRAATIDSNEYGKQRRQLRGEALDQYSDQLKQHYATMIGRTAYPEGDPEANIAGMLRSLGPASLFPLDETLVKKLLMSYGSDRRRDNRKGLVGHAQRVPMPER